LPTTFTIDPGLMTLTFTAPPVGAVLFTYLPTLPEFTIQLLPWGMRNVPPTPS